MALPNDYAGQSCSVARSLEVIGERWTMLIVRDAFYGVRRFGEFATHLAIPRAVLASRLRSLVAEGVLERVPGDGGHDEYALTGKGTALWPILRDLMAWGDRFYSPRGPRRVLTHVADDGVVDSAGRCALCDAIVEPGDTLIAPGPGFDAPAAEPGELSAAFAQPQRLLAPLSR